MSGYGDRLHAAKRGANPHVVALVVAGAVGAVLVLSLMAFAADQALHAGRVARNVSVGGRDASSDTKDALAAALQEVDRRYATTSVLVSDDAGDSWVTDAGSLGIRVDAAATERRVLGVGRGGSVPRRWLSWLGSFRTNRQAELALSVDRGAVERLVAEKGGKGDVASTEPSIQIDKHGRLVGVPGRTGKGIDAARLADDLTKAANGGTPIKVRVRRGDRPPRFTSADADALATRAEALVAAPLNLVAEGTIGSLPTATLRSLLSAVPGATQLELRVDEAAATAAAAKALAQAGRPPVEPTFKIGSDGAVVPVPGALGRGCCGPEAGRVLGDAILRRTESPVSLALVDRQPMLSDERAVSLGVKEQVSTFATNHVCCQPRVTNIHRIADLVRGQVIPPGSSFSVNEFVGERTVEKGFVIDKVIADGRFGEDVGGGVSQFATTLFNAAWFAGLEFGEYQSHSLYISRYPKGRDATLGFPHPDLVIKNPTPYGIMIWPTYTDTELTVSLYSTKWVDVQATGQDTQSNGSCTVYVAKRQRTFLDGRVVNDNTKAQYRANQGQNCGDAQPSPAPTGTARPAPSPTR